MKSTNKIYLVVFIIFIALFLSLYQSDKKDAPESPDTEIVFSGQTVTSEDGTVTIDIPEGALPAGTKIEDISITENLSDFASGAAEGTEELIDAVYTLQPHGLKFEKPVRVLMNYKTDPDELLLPQIIHIAEDEYEFIEDMNVIDNEEGVVLDFEINHFSHLLRMLSAPFAVTFRGGAATYNVGDSFSFELEITPGRNWGGAPDSVSIEYKEKPHHYSSYMSGTLLPDEPWTIKPINIATGGVVTPASVNFPGGTFRGRTTQKYTEVFTCATEGYDRIQFPDHISFAFTMTSWFEQPALKSLGREVSVAENDNRYNVEGTYRINPDNTNLPVRCVEPGEGQMVRIAPPYLIICADGTSLSGPSVLDARTGEQLRDANGSVIDANTRQPVRCP